MAPLQCYSDISKTDLQTPIYYSVFYSSRRDTLIVNCQLLIVNLFRKQQFTDFQPRPQLFYKLGMEILSGPAIM